MAEAMLLANSAVIVSSVFPARMLGRSLGIYMAGFSVASLLGPTVGGALVTSFGWRWVFWFNVPLGLACLLLGAIVLRPMPATRGPSRFDLRGNILLILGLGGFIVALSAVSTEGWTSPLVAIGAALAVVFLPLFLWTQHHGKDPAAGPDGVRQPPVLPGHRRRDDQRDGDQRRRHPDRALLPGRAGQHRAGGRGFWCCRWRSPRSCRRCRSGLLTRRMEADAVAALGASATTVGLVLLMIGTSRHSPYAFLMIGLIVIGVGSGIFAPANAAASLQSAEPGQLGPDQRPCGSPCRTPPGSPAPPSG